MKVCVLILLAALVACAYSAVDDCGAGCVHADGGSHTFCENSCTDCNGHHQHVHCNHQRDMCECHVNDHTHPPHP